MAVEPKITIARILADLNLAVRYGIAIRIYASRKFGGCNIDHQTAKFNSLPNFLAIRYYNIHVHVGAGGKNCQKFLLVKIPLYSMYMYIV